MSIPSGYKLWAEMRGLSPWHPESWSSGEHEGFVAWKLARFRESWHGYVESGHAALIREQSGRRALINHVKADLAEALKPMVRNPWKLCPCHPHHFSGEGEEEHPWQNSFIYAGTRSERVLVWMAKEFRR